MTTKILTVKFEVKDIDLPSETQALAREMIIEGLELLQQKWAKMNIHKEKLILIDALLNDGSNWI